MALFPNDSLRRLAVFVCKHHATFRVSANYITVILPYTVTGEFPAYKDLYGEGVVKVCYKRKCFNGETEEKVKEYYKDITVYVNYDTSIFMEPGATTLCGVPVDKKYWTGRRVNINHYVDEKVLEDELTHLAKKTECQKIELGIYRCPDLYENKANVGDCKDKIIIAERDLYYGKKMYLRKAEILYDVYGMPVYIVPDVKKFCSAETPPFTPPLPLARQPTYLVKFVEEAVKNYAYPQSPTVRVYLTSSDTLYVPVLSKAFKVNENDPVPTVKQILEEMVKRGMITTICENINKLTFNKTDYYELKSANERGIKCFT